MTTVSLSAIEWGKETCSFLTSYTIVAHRSRIAELKRRFLRHEPRRSPRDGRLGEFVDRNETFQVVGAKVFARARLNGELSQENLDGAAQPRPNSTIPVNGEVCTGKAFDQRFQVTEGRYAAAEIFEPETHAARTHGFEEWRRVAQIGDCRGLRDIEADLVRIKRHRLHQIVHIAVEIAIHARLLN